MKSPKKSCGRQRIELKKISKERNLQVTFSKRRSGLFKKASELCTLCETDVALVVFSPGEKVFSFGHPNVEVVIDRFLAQTTTPISGTIQFIEAHRTANVRELNAQLMQINNRLDAEQKRCKELAHVKNASQVHMWWAMPIDQMSMPQLDQYKVALKGLKKHVAVLASDRARIESTGNLTYPPMPENYMFSHGTMMSHHGFNMMGMGGYGPTGGSFF